MKITDRIVYRLSLIFVLVFAAVMILGYLDVAQGQAVASEGETASSMIDDFMKRDNTDKIIVALIFLSPGDHGCVIKYFICPN